VTLALAAAGLLYGLAAARRPWPVHRVVCWYAGLVAAGVGFALRGDFAVHVAGHLLLGMVAPLLLVLGAPVTLALRALRVSRARRLSAVLHALRPVTFVGTAAVLDAGGMWLFYGTDLYGLAMRVPIVHTLVGVHMLAAGYLLTAVLVGPDPVPGRPRPLVRAVVLIAVAASHAVLAKHLYASPPPGVPAGSGGALLLYYGGDAVELVLAVLLCRRWLAVKPVAPVPTLAG
jgi:putative membrane protein